MRTLDRVTSACQRWWLWTTVTGDGVTQGQFGQGRRGAGVHGSTPYHRLATSDVSVALAKAAQAGFPRRGRPRPWPHSPSRYVLDLQTTAHMVEVKAKARSRRPARTRFSANIHTPTKTPPHSLHNDTLKCEGDSIQ